MKQVQGAESRLDPMISLATQVLVSSRGRITPKSTDPEPDCIWTKKESMLLLHSHNELQDNFVEGDNNCP